MKKIFHFFASLKLAVFVLLGLACSLATGTIVESLYDTPTAQYYIYHSIWFEGLLSLLGVNIVCSALSRYPFKRKHFPFVCAHIGIILMLFGSWLTQAIGLDGSMRITEGETSSIVEIDKPLLIVTDGNGQTKMVPISWRPPSVEFHPVNLNSMGLPYDVTIDQYLSHADPTYFFVPSVGRNDGVALKVNLSGGPMARILGPEGQDFWLWQGDRSFSDISAGPARMVLSSPHSGMKDLPELRGFQPTVVFTPDLAQKKLSYSVQSPKGKAVQGSFPLDQVIGKVIDPDWKGVKITLSQFYLSANPQATYKSSRMLYGQGAPPSAIHLVAGGGKPGEGQLWLGLGDRAVLKIGGQNIGFSYYPERMMLPFSIRLDRFTVDHYEGSNDPSEYSSLVSVVGKSPSSVKISMNEPLHQDGVTLYQASFEDAQPRPVTSIFSVNRDPGRPWKYAGSLFIVLGTIALFVSRLWNQRKKEIKV